MVVDWVANWDVVKVARLVVVKVAVWVVGMAGRRDGLEGMLVVATVASLAAAKVVHSVAKVLKLVAVTGPLLAASMARWLVYMTVDQLDW